MEFIMVKLISFLVASVFLGASLFLNSCSEDSTTPTPQEFIADNSTFSGFSSWTLVDTRNGADPALGGMAHGGNNETVTRKIYIKENKSLVNGQYPVGTVVVKQSTNPEGMNEITAMVKRGNKFNTEAGDWEWFMLEPNGNIADGGKMRGAKLMDGMCAGCHAGASAKDYVFTKK